MVATGSLDGEVVIWDFELSKILSILNGHSSDITGLEFLDTYPYLITSSLDCTVCLWGVRPAPIAYRYICLHRFMNRSWFFTKDIDAPIYKIYFLKKSMAPIKV